MGAARRLVILTEASNRDEGEAEGDDETLIVPRERHTTGTMPVSSKISTTSTMTTVMETPPLPRFRVPALPPSRSRQQPQQQQQQSLLPPTELGRRVTSTLRRSQMLQATPYRRTVSTVRGADSSAREKTDRETGGGSGTGPDPGGNGGGVLEKIKGVVSWLLSGLTRVGVPSTPMSPDESHLRASPPHLFPLSALGRREGGLSGEVMTVLRERLARSRTTPDESEDAPHYRQEGRLDRHCQYPLPSSSFSSSSTTTTTTTIMGAGADTGMESETGMETVERKMPVEWRNGGGTATTDSRHESYQRLVRSANRRTPSRRVMYANLSHFFRLCSQQPSVLLTREEYEELSLLIQRQGVRRHGPLLVERKGPAGQAGEREEEGEGEDSIEMEMEMMRAGDGDRAGPMETPSIERASSSLAVPSSLVAPGLAALSLPPPSPLSATAEEARSTISPLLGEEAMAILPPPPGPSPSQEKRVTGAVHGRPPSKRTARIFSARFDEDEEALAMEGGDGSRILGQQASSQGRAIISANRRRLIEEARRRVAQQIRQATATGETEARGTGAGTESGQGSRTTIIETAKEMEAPLISLGAGTPMRKKSVSFAPEVVKFEFTIPAAAGGIHEQGRTTDGEESSRISASAAPPKLIFDFDGTGGRRASAALGTAGEHKGPHESADKGTRLATVTEEPSLSLSSPASAPSGGTLRHKEVMGSAPVPSKGPLGSVGALEFPSATTTIKISSASTPSRTGETEGRAKERATSSVPNKEMAGTEGGAATAGGPPPLSFAPPKFSFGTPSSVPPPTGGTEASSAPPFPFSVTRPTGGQSLSFTASANTTSGGGEGTFSPAFNGGRAGGVAGTAKAAPSTGNEGANGGGGAPPPLFTFGVTAGGARPSADTGTTGGSAPPSGYFTVGTGPSPSKSPSSPATVTEPSSGGTVGKSSSVPALNFAMPASSVAGGGEAAPTAPAGATFTFGAFGSNTTTSVGESSSLSKSSAVPPFSFGGHVGGPGGDVNSASDGFSFRGAPQPPSSAGATRGAFGFGTNATAAGTGPETGINASLPSSSAPAGNVGSPFTFGGGGGGGGMAAAPASSTPFGSAFPFAGAGGGISSTMAMGSAVPPPFGVTAPPTAASMASPFSAGGGAPFGSANAAGSTLAPPASTTTTGVAPFSFGGAPSSSPATAPMQFNFGAAAATPGTMPFTFGTGGGGLPGPGGATDTIQSASSASGTAAGTRKFSVPATRRRK